MTTAAYIAIAAIIYAVAATIVTLIALHRYNKRPIGLDELGMNEDERAIYYDGFSFTGNRIDNTGAKPINFDPLQ